VVKIRDVTRRSDELSDAVVVSWVPRAHWHPNTKAGGGARGACGSNGLAGAGGEFGGKRCGGGDTTEDDDDDDDDEGGLGVEDFQFHGTVFLVRIVPPAQAVGTSGGHESSRSGTSSLSSGSSGSSGGGKACSGGVVRPLPAAKAHRNLLRRGALLALPETALVFPSIATGDFSRATIAQCDWLFGSDGSCVINDHRCVPLDRAVGRFAHAAR